MVFAYESLVLRLPKVSGVCRDSESVLYHQHRITRTAAKLGYLRSLRRVGVEASVRRVESNDLRVVVAIVIKRSLGGCTPRSEVLRPRDVAVSNQVFVLESSVV